MCECGAERGTGDKVVVIVVPRGNRIDEYSRKLKKYLVISVSVFI